MSLFPYPKYQESGTDWLEQVPSHWQLRRLGLYFDERREKVSDKDFPALSVTVSGVVPQLESAAKTDDGDNRKRVCIGDFVINSRSDRKGSAGTSALDGSVSLINTVLSPTGDINIAFAHYLLRSVPFQEEFYRYGKGIVADLWSTNYSEMRNIRLAMPSLGEQAAIAAFLDHETHKIDKLILEQERLLALVAEKRQATISHAVTRGLNPDAPTMDSSTEWLGRIPAHWTITRLKYTTSHIVDCPHETPIYDDEGPYKVIRTADTYEGTLDTNRIYRVAETEYCNRIRRQALMKDDIVYSREGGRWGYAAQVPQSDTFCLGQRMMQFRAASSVCPRYLMWQLNAMSTYRQGEMDTVGAASPHVNVSTIRNYVLAEPPLAEQVQISAFLDAEIHKLDGLKAHAERAIDLLRERRSAVISDAVTGKIDVRNVVPQELAA